MLELDDVCFERDGRPYIYPTKLELERGSLNVLLGPTLAGKTTMMRIMAGLDKPSSGRLLWDGVDVTGTRVQDRNVAMVYQQFINYPGMTVFENIASPLRLQGKSKLEIQSEVKKVADLLKLTPLLDRKPLELSGGQQQRCALARVLAKGADLVLLDEPLANLDYKLREELRSEIPRIFEKSGSIFVYATTEPEEALLLGGNTATLWEGRVTQFGVTHQVFRQPKDLITARVFSDPPFNTFDVSKKGRQISSGTEQSFDLPAAIKDLPDGDYTAGFRPAHLELQPTSNKDMRFDCTCNATEITGSETFVHLSHQDTSWVGVLHGVQDIATGSALSVYLNPDRTYLFNPSGNLCAHAVYAVEK